MLCYDKLCYVMRCHNVLWYVVLGHDMLWHAMICFEIRKSTVHNLYVMIWKLCYEWNEFIRGYVYILPSIIRDERIGVVLHDLLRHHEKYEYLMHNCMFTYIRILLFMMSTNVYTMRLKWSSCLPWCYNGRCSLWVSGVTIALSSMTVTSDNSPEKLARPIGLGGVRTRLVGPYSHVWVMYREILHPIFPN